MAEKTEKGSRYSKTSTVHKRKALKSEISYRVTLNEEQEEARLKILHDDIAVITGSAGSGKTLLCVRIALDGFFRKEFERIVITRPTVSDEEIGFLPGNIKEKMDPWLAPIYHNMYSCYGNKQKIDRHLEEGDIEIAPISFLRGITFVNSCIIVDEAQNITRKQMEMILTRLGHGSKMLICGDVAQSDLKKNALSGFAELFNMSEKIEGFNTYSLTTNMRHPIVEKVLAHYKES